MLDLQFWDILERAWAPSGDLRDRIRRREPFALDALSHVILGLADALMALREQDGMAFVAIWRPRAHGLLATGRVPTLELACFLVAMGRRAYDEALQGLWSEADDPSEGAFAAMLGSFDDESSPVSPLAKGSSSSLPAGPDTPAPSAVRVRKPPTE